MFSLAGPLVPRITGSFDDSFLLHSLRDWRTRSRMPLRQACSEALEGFSEFGVVVDVVDAVNDGAIGPD